MQYEVSLLNFLHLSMHIRVKYYQMQSCIFPYTKAIRRPYTGICGTVFGIITWIALLNGQYGKWANLIGLESSYYKAILPVKKRQLIFKVNKAQCSVFLCKENTVKFSLLIQKINHCLSFPKIWIPWPCNKRDTDCFVHLYEKYKAFGSA